MVITENANTIIIKRHAANTNHARIGIMNTWLSIDGQVRQVRGRAKPHGEVTMDDCRELLHQLEDLEQHGNKAPTSLESIPVDPDIQSQVSCLMRDRGMKG